MVGRTFCSDLQTRLPLFAIQVPFFRNKDWGLWLQMEYNSFRMGLRIYSNPDADPDPQCYTLMPSIHEPKQWFWSSFLWIDQAQDVLALIHAVTRDEAHPFLIAQGPTPSHMATSDFFRPDYRSAREAFLAAAHAAGAGLTSHVLPDHRGPAGESLAIDAATLGPAEPESLLLLISGTHGVEGLAGSGCQVGVLLDELHGALPAGCGALLIHALNPHGFAWLRRGNEDNVDLNRNGLDFRGPLPDNQAYDDLHYALLPGDWDWPERQLADALLEAFIREQGMAAYQAALQRGQYTHPTGLFYGGSRTSWSLATLGRILTDHLGPACRRLALIDLHTGLGPWGYGELIGSGSNGDDWERLQRWYGPEVTRPGLGPSSSSVVSGSVTEFLRRMLPAVELTFLVLEFGTRPIDEVLAALRADAWLHAVPDRPTPHREAIRRQVREAFLIDSPAWRAAVYGRCADVVLRACRGLGG